MLPRIRGKIFVRRIQQTPAYTLEALTEFARRDQLELPETYLSALDATLERLMQEGGLVQLQDLPTIVIPDLHARRGLLIDILGTRIEAGSASGSLVFELVQQGRMNVVCVGDIVHSETRSDWVINFEGEWTRDLLDKEMVRSLGAAAMMMYLKIQYPANFHCLRGNHDDMAGELAEDFRKFVGLKYDAQDELVLTGDGSPVLTGDKGESKLVREWVLNREGWGRPFLYRWSRFDRALPLMAQGSYYVISHTLPCIAVSKADIQDIYRPRIVTLELTSRRGENREAVEGTLESLGIKQQVKRWFYGHSQVPLDKNDGKYEESLDGLALRLNNPKKYVFAYVPGSSDERLFDPTKDVYIKAPDEDAFYR